MKIKTLFMETTKIPTGQTVAEIQRILGECGASAVMTEYDRGEIQAVCFKVIYLDRDVPFRLPCRHQSIYNELMSRKKKPRKNTEIEVMEQAKKVAWRQILRWVEAQMALVSTEMVKIQEVFLPYMQVGKKGETIFEQIENKGFPQVEYKPKQYDNEISQH